MPAVLSFPLYGPSRRADVPVIEVRLDRRAADFPHVCPSAEEVRRRMAPLDPGFRLDDGSQPGSATNDHVRRFADLLGRLALQLQRAAGHPVEWLEVRESRFADWRMLVLVEHAHPEVGLAAVQLAVLVLGPRHPEFAGQYARFLDFARARALPDELAALAHAARRRGVPCLVPGHPPLDRALPTPPSGRGPSLWLGQGEHGRQIHTPLGLGSGADDLGLDRAAEAHLKALYPAPSAARIPLVAVTGTNGKTTTTRMVAHLLKAAGWTTGLVTSEGIELAGRRLLEGDAGSFAGHARVLTDASVQAAALEAHHRGIVLRGFAFQDCDVGICLNVSPDHIAPGEIETMAEMEDVKAAIPERASEAAVLFADDPHCRAMGTRLRAKATWWVSLEQSAEQLSRLPGSGRAVFLVLAEREGVEWIVLHRDGAAEPLMPVKAIPATFAGDARFMVSNAMHAAAAALALGMAQARVVEALSGFAAGEATTPGRLNEIEGLPFRLILDFAHNPDGMARLAEFTDRLSVPGRKLLALSGMGKREDVINRQSAQAVAGHFDHYFCKEYTPSQPPLKRPVAPLMQAALVDAGVAPEDTTLLGHGKAVFFDILSECAPGDLLVYLIGNAEKAAMGAYIQEFRRRGGGSTWTAAAARAEQAWFASLASRDPGYVSAVEARLETVRRKALARTLLALGREGLLPARPEAGDFDCDLPGGRGRIECEGFSASPILLRSDLRRLRILWNDGRSEEVAHPARLLEVLAGVEEDPAPWERLAMEISDSVLNEALALAAHARTNAGLDLDPDAVDAGAVARSLDAMGPAPDGSLFLDQWAATGHPLHTVPKTRIGLAPALALDLCPEFHPRVPVRLAAVRRESVSAELPAGCTGLAMWFRVQYPAWFDAWESALTDQGCVPEDYAPFPVHPWQAEHVLASAFSGAGHQHDVTLLDGPELPMLPCLSVRSMVPAEHAGAPGFKLALGVRLTSGVRTITPRSCHMGPRVSRLLRGLFESDDGYGGMADLLDETLGAHYRADADRADLEKQFSFIVRDAVAGHVEAGLVAAPAAALGEPFPLGGPPLLLGLTPHAHESRDSLGRFGAYTEAFLRLVLRTYLVYGIALEAHGQNVLACFDREGRLRKFLLRDLAGIRIHQPTLKRRGLALKVHPDRRTVVQDFKDHRFWLRHRAYHCHLGHIAHGLSVATGTPEPAYWRQAGEITAQVFDELRDEVDPDHWARERSMLLEDDWVGKASLSMRLKDQVRDLSFQAFNPLRAG